MIFRALSETLFIGEHKKVWGIFLSPCKELCVIMRSVCLVINFFDEVYESI